MGGGGTGQKSFKSGQDWPRMSAKAWIGQNSFGTGGNSQTFWGSAQECLWDRWDWSEIIQKCMGLVKNIYRSGWDECPQKQEGLVKSV